MVIHYPPARLRRNSDQPTAITDVLINGSGSSSRTGDIPLGTPTCSARSRQGRWALYPNGDQVVVVLARRCPGRTTRRGRPRAGPSGGRPR